MNFHFLTALQNARSLTRQSPSAIRDFHAPHSAFRTPHSESGIALVITLILLSVITFMAVTFLVVSRRERGAVTTMTDQANATFAADAAVERAKAQLIAAMLAQTNGLNS